MNCGPSSVRRRIPGTTPEVLTVMWRAPSPNRFAVVERLDRLEHPVQVEQRLAHAHEHDVGQAALVAGEAALRVAHLVDDLRGLEVPLHPELAGRAERAAHGAPGLRADAQRVPLAAPLAGRVVHQDRLDQQPVRQPVERPSRSGRRRRGGPRRRRRCRTGTRPRGRRGRRPGGSGSRRSPDSRPRHAASRTWRARYAGWPRSVNHAAQRVRRDARRCRAADRAAPVAEGAGRRPNGAWSGKGRGIGHRRRF